MPFFKNCDIAQISVTYGAYIDTPSITKDAMYRPIALKLANATHFLVTLGEDDAVSGPRMLWDWRADSFTELAGGESNDAHDIAWAAEGEAFWQMDGTTSLKEWGAYDATAKALAHVKTHRLGDPNHAQLVEDDAVAYISSRSTNGIVKVNTTDDATVWVLGGLRVVRTAVAAKHGSGSVAHEGVDSGLAARSPVEEYALEELVPQSRGPRCDAALRLA